MTVRFAANHLLSLAACAGSIALHTTLVGAAPPKPPPEPLPESLCPASIVVEQRAGAVPEGWEAVHSPFKPQLAFVTFFDGPPAERASLTADSEERPKREWVAIWNFAPNKRGYWLKN